MYPTCASNNLHDANCAADDDGHDSKDDMPWISEEWSPAIAGISWNESSKDWLRLAPFTIARFRQQLDAWYTDSGGSVARFTHHLLGKGSGQDTKTVGNPHAIEIARTSDSGGAMGEGAYAGVAPHGFSMWGTARTLCRKNTTSEVQKESRSTAAPVPRSRQAHVSDVGGSSDGNTTATTTGSTTGVSTTANAADHTEGNMASKDIADHTIKEGGVNTAKSACDALSQRGRCFEQGGPHWRTAEAAQHAVNLPRYAGVGRTAEGKKWHPSIGLHLLRAEVLVYAYAHIIADAAYMLDRDLSREDAAAAAAAAVGGTQIEDMLSYPRSSSALRLMNSK